MPDPSPHDDDLLAAIRAGDEGPLRVLMARYDRLVRFTIYRTARAECLRDPQWLDSVASDVWSGFITGLQRRAGHRQDLRTYLIQIARNKCIDALRRQRREQPSLAGDQPRATELPGDEAGPLELLTNLEELERLRSCLARLDSNDQAICRQIPLIIERKWQEAGRALGMPESTLRSRWPQIVAQLAVWMTDKAP